MYILSCLTLQFAYNLLWRGVEDEILPMCIKHNIGLLPYSPLQQGLLTGKFLKPEDVPIGRRRTKFFNSQTLVCFICIKLMN